MWKDENGIAGGCWREKRNQAVSWRAFVIFSSLLLLAVIEPKVEADLASEANVLLEIKRIWRNPPQLSNWSNITLICSGEWLGVKCDERNTTVTALELNSILLNSAIPPIVGNLTNLTYLVFDSCNLVGEIPSTIGSLKSLQILNFGANSLTGSIPAELGDLTNLTSLYLSINNLTSLPDLSGLRSIQRLDLSQNNELTGPVPSWLGNLSQLEVLRLDIVNFRGSIPPEIGNLENLREISMSSSGLSGNLPPELGNLKSLVSMQLNGNHLTGNIPDSFRNLQNLQIMILTENNLNGSLGSWFGDLHSLEQLVLDANLFAGPIPFELGTLVNLTQIILGNNQLSGEIPTSLGNLTNLQVLALEFNYISGPVPSSILSLPNLQVLTLNDNCFNGSAPVNLSNFSKSSFVDNCFNDSSQSQPCKCVTAAPSNIARTSESSNNKSTIYISVGVVLGALLVVAIVIFIYLKRRWREEILPPPPGSVRRYRLPEITETTKNFTTVVGRGGQATVYKAEFKDGRVAAVKRFGHDVEHRRKRHAVKTFNQEVLLLSRLNHRFLVNLVGYCEETGEYMLLFDYMDMGSLYDHLHGIHSAKTAFTWDERVSIVICVACGIDYLHYGCSPPVFHRDIKSANILLSSEQKLIAKVADFGLGKLTSIDDEGDDADVTAEPPKAEATAVMGSHGYMDPEFLRTAIYSEKSDIYSYGVVLLELITGRKAVEKGKFFMTEWVKPYLAEPGELLKIVDPKLEGKFVEEELLAIADIARSCIDPQPNNRPTIRDILHRLRTDFKRQTTMISPPSERTTSSGVEFSGLEISGEIRNNSVYTYTQSEIVPRD